jgi:hypothetical protein
MMPAADRRQALASPVEGIDVTPVTDGSMTQKRGALLSQFVPRDYGLAEALGARGTLQLWLQCLQM